jgi:hypothetical protein
VIKLTIQLDTKGLGRLDKLTGTTRTAASTALTWTAKDAQKALKSDTESVFHLRNRWVPGGIRIKPANRGSMEAQVGSIDKYMERHVMGAHHPPKKAGNALVYRGGSGKRASGGLLVPVYGSIGDAKTHTKARNRLKRMEGTKRKPFVIKAKSGKVLLVRRATKKRLSLVVLAALENQVHITPEWNFKGEVQGVVNARFGENFLRAMAKYD